MGPHFVVAHYVEVHFVVAEISLAPAAMTNCQPDGALTGEFDDVGCS